MNTDLRQIKDEVAQKHHKKDWVIAKCLFTSDLMFILYEEVIERYAAACVEEQHKEWFKETEKTLVEAGQAIGAMFTKQQVEEACRKTLEEQWISVKDRLPEERLTHCLVFNGDAPEYNQHVFQANYYTQTKEFVAEGTHAFLGTITHWQPLPSTPIGPTIKKTG